MLPISDLTLLERAIDPLVGAVRMRQSDVAPEVFSILVPGTLILLFPMSAKIVSWLKDRITHPRTGYVKFSEKRSRSRMAVALMVLVVALGLVAILTEDYSLEGTVRPAALAGVGMGACALLALRAWKMAIPRLYIAAATLAGTTIWAVTASKSFSEGLGSMWVALGVTTVLTGTITLSRYLRTHPRAAVESS